MLRCVNEQLILNDWENGVDYVEAGDELGNVSGYDIAYLKLILSDAEVLYKIYERGVDRMHKYFNAEYRANYILNTLKENGVC